MGESRLVKEIVANIQRIAKLTGRSPNEVTQAQFLAECKDKYSSYDLRKIGGYSSLIKAYWPDENKELKTIQSQKNHSAYTRKLEQIVGNREAFLDKVVTSVGGIIKDLNVNVTQLNSKVTKNYLDLLFKKEMGDEKKESRSICTIWSDQHFGTNVDGNELGGKNEFNWLIGSRRLGMLCEQTATYKIEKRHLHSELVIFLIGDNIGGVIHNQEGPDYDLLIHQVCGTTAYYTQALNYLKQFFPKIRVICQPGNHGRVQHKTSKDRALSQKYDSFENIIFYSLSQIFASDPKVIFSVTKAPFSDTEVQNHRIYATHGDTVFSVGNVGDIVPIKKIEQQINRINAEELNHGKKPYEMVCTGHVHHPLITQVNSGVKVAINGCLIGSDSFALSIGIQSSHPVQILWETTKKFVQGDSRFIYVAKANDDAKYNKIITPYSHELVAQKLLD
jgi:hypothetical protein